MTFDPTGTEPPANGESSYPKGARIYPIKRLRKALQKPISDALSALRGKPFTIAQSRAAIEGVLRGVDLNLYSQDISWQLEEAERRRRNSSYGKAIAHAIAMDDMFKVELAREVWIPLGQQQQVCLVDATHLHIQHKREEQRLDAEKVLQAMHNTDAFVLMLGPEFARNPTETVGDAMRRIGRW